MFPLLVPGLIIILPLAYVLGTYNRTATTEKQAVIMEKDFHLLEAALATDGLIASLDRESRKLFERAARSVRRLRTLVWVDPTSVENDPIGWLKAGAPTQKKFHLCADEPSS